MTGGTLLASYAKVYKKIGATLQRELPAGWMKAWAYCEMDSHDGLVVVYYLDAERNVAWIRPPLPLYECYRELNDAAREGGEAQVWTTATFALEANGKFNVDFGYGAVPIEEEQARRTAWKLRYLPA
jgi:hypothetical protein